MNLSEPNIPDTARLPIGKAAEVLGVDRKTLLKKTQDGLIKCGLRRDTMRKFYTGVELKRFWRAQA